LLLDDENHLYIAGLLIGCRTWVDFLISLCSYGQIDLLAEQGVRASMTWGWQGCPPSRAASDVPGTVQTPVSCRVRWCHTYH